MALGPEQPHRLEQARVVLVRPRARRIEHEVLARTEVGPEALGVHAQVRHVDPLLRYPQQLDDPALGERTDGDHGVRAPRRGLIGDPAEDALDPREEVRQIAVLEVEQHLHVTLTAGGIGQGYREGEVQHGLAAEPPTQAPRAQQPLEHPDRATAMAGSALHPLGDDLGHSLAEAARVLGDQSLDGEPLLPRPRDQEARQRTGVGLAAAHPARIDGEHSERDGERFRHGVQSCPSRARIPAAPRRSRWPLTPVGRM
ncbi:hypothetical protein ACH61_00853 [Rathayibacter tanaceti]|uniref:Uncharacterized protein n=1 Tax=Rathayibacter tanaceti TaxID=1671680 RepID=A0A162GJ27_9MICO|nr:hypothetical protein [Rathayibacter tanaceti]KZX21999.1 hypothetical protein ACH61_00853 [Rathayibacter tanaceti]